MNNPLNDVVGTTGKVRHAIMVWDMPVRVFHWLLVICFAGAWLSSESERWEQMNNFDETISGRDFDNFHFVEHKCVWAGGTRAPIASVQSLTPHTHTHTHTHTHRCAAW